MGNNIKHDADTLLRRALSSTETPDQELLRKIKNSPAKEDTTIKKTNKKRYLGTVAAAVAALVLITTTAFAAWIFLTPAEVADKFDDHSLSAAFESAAAVNINQSVTSGDYIFTLLSVVSGEDITDTPYHNDSISNERTYAVVAIQKADGTPMPDTLDEDYGSVPFLATPLIRGLNPWTFNAVTMNGAYSTTVADGVMYRIVECDGVTMFADRGLYFAVCSSTFPSSDIFSFDEQTGEIAINPDYQGASAVFDLPIDPSLADPEKAEQYIADILNFFN